MPAQLLMVALDGSDGHLIDRMTRAGELPHLAALRQRGMFRFLDNSDEMSDDSIWASFHFGAPLAEHGRYHYLRPLKSGKIGMGVNEEDGSRTFWARLSARGLSVAVLDIPKCPRPVALNGIQLADWLVHGRYFKGPQSYPPDLAPETVARFGAPARSWCDFHQDLPDDDQIRAMLADFLDWIEMKRRAALHHLAARDWDLFVVGFKEAHCAGHGLWQLADPGHAEYDADRVARLGDPIGTIYRALDAALGDLVAAAGPEAEIVAFSNSFMEPNGTVLHLQEALAARIDADLTARYGRFSEAANNRLRALRGRPLRHLCQTVPSNENHVALRLSRRDPARFDAMMDDTLTLLAGITDPETGQPVFDRIDRPSTLRTGASADVLPDIVAWCRPNAMPAALASNSLGRIEAEGRRMRPGNHSMGGAVIAAGPRVAALAPTLVNMSDFAGLAEAVFFGPAADSTSAA